MKRILILALLLMSVFTVFAFAETTDANELLKLIADEAGVELPQKYIIDNGILLSQAEKEELEAKLIEIENTFGVHILLATAMDVNSTSGMDSAEAIFEQNEIADGGVLFINLHDNKWGMYLGGTMNTVFSEEALNSITEDTLTVLKSHGVYNAFFNFIHQSEYVLENPRELNVFEQNADIITLSIRVIGSVVVGFLVAFIVLAISSAKLKNAQIFRDCYYYVNPYSVKFTVSNDILLSETLTSSGETVQKKQRKSNSDPLEDR